jgi:hypothetical protein
MTATGASGVEVRARQSRGIGNDAIMEMVCRALERWQISGECRADVGASSRKSVPPCAFALFALCWRAVH